MTNQTVNSGLTLVTGATGKTGRRIIDRMAAANYPIRAGSRSSTPPFDWADRSTWDAALDGVATIYVAYQPDLAVPGALDVVRAFFTCAAAKGVSKIVLLSGRGEVEAEEVEQVLQATAFDWTILRCSWFSQNFSENFFLDSILAGKVALPKGLAPEPFVDVEDIADIAFAALTGVGHSQQLYELTGPRAISFAQAIAEIAEAAGREIYFMEVSSEDYRRALTEAQLPQEVIDLVLYLFSTVLDGRNTPIADGVQQALGRPASDFADYTQRTAATGIWKG